MTVLDTDFLIALIRGNPDAQRKLVHLMRDRHPLTTTTVNAAELYRGAYRAPNSRRAIAKARRVLRTLRVFPLDVAAGEEYGRLAADLEKEGKPIGDLDTLIAAIARARGESVVSRNRKHFSRVPGLVLDSW